MAFFIQFADASSASSAYVQFLNLIFGSCWLFMFIAEDITKDVTSFNIATRQPDENRVELMKSFCDIVQIYTDAKK